MSATRITEEAQALAALLEAEIAAIEAGRAADLAARFEEKSTRAARIEAAGPEIEAALAQEDAAAGDLRAALDHLAALTARNAAMLERMRDASARLLRDLTRLRDRHGLGGLYGADGNRSNADTLSRLSMDKSI